MSSLAYSSNGTPKVFKTLNEQSLKCAIILC